MLWLIFLFRSVNMELRGRREIFTDVKEVTQGNIADVSTVIRVALTSSSMTPDLYELMKLLGTTRINERIKKVIEIIRDWPI